MTYVAVIAKQEYCFPDLQEAANFIYHKVKKLAEAGEIHLKFDVYYKELNQQRDLNSFETNSFNRYCKDLWEKHASPAERQALQQYKEEEAQSLKSNKDKLN